MLVVFEGIDGSGKGTQIELLSSFLESRNTTPAIHKYPTENAKEAHAHLCGEKHATPEELFSSFAKDIKSEQALLHDELSKGKFVILDRYVFSTVAYQGAALGYERCRNAIRQIGYLHPDVTLLLDISPEDSSARKSAQKTLDKFEEDREFLEGVRSRYLKMADEDFLCPRWRTIDASAKKEEVFSKTKECLLDLL